MDQTRSESTNDQLTLKGHAAPESPIFIPRGDAISPLPAGRSSTYAVRCLIATEPLPKWQEAHVYRRLSLTPAPGPSYEYGTFSPDAEVWSGFNNHGGSHMFHNTSPSGLPVRVMEAYPSGSRAYSYSGNGDLSVCHGTEYTKAGCKNISSYWMYTYCEKRVGGTC